MSVSETARYRVSPHSGKRDSIFTFSAAFLGVGAGTGYSLSFPTASP